MPPHDKRYDEKYWDDMPDVAHKAAATLGYTKESWDADGSVPYDTKTFFQCTNPEKQAAVFLNLKLIEKKLNVWWSDLDKPTMDHAAALGWSQATWDDDYEIVDLAVDKVYWKDLTAPQQAAALHFGYTKATWDETWAADDYTAAAAGKKMFTAPPAGKVFAPIGKPANAAANGDKKEEHNSAAKMMQPLKKLFGKQ